jgi:exonuclease VII large subunit
MYIRQMIEEQRHLIATLQANQDTFDEKIKENDIKLDEFKNTLMIEFEGKVEDNDRRFTDMKNAINRYSTHIYIRTFIYMYTCMYEYMHTFL